MKDSSFEAQKPLNVRGPASPSGRPYALHSDLAKFCLPAAVQDPNCKYAWANSICFLFLMIGLIGLKSPELITKQMIPVTDVVPVVFTPPPEEQVRPEPQPQEEPDPTQEAPVDVPQVAIVVAANPAAVAFAVPVEGPVVFAPAQFASPAPATPPKATRPLQPTLYRPTGGEAGTHPWPKTYPRVALERREEGTVMVSVVVDTTGLPSTVEVKESSGSSTLDRFAVQWVKTRWRWERGEARHYWVPFVFQLK